MVWVSSLREAFQHMLASLGTAGHCARLCRGHREEQGRVPDVSEGAQAKENSFSATHQ